MKIIKILVFTLADTEDTATGRKMLADMNSFALKDMYGSKLEILYMDTSLKSTRILDKYAAMIGWLDGLNPEILQQCHKLIKERNIRVIYIEGSNYGRLARALRKIKTDCFIVTFFHNVEARFFWGALKARPSLKALAVLIANWNAERWAVQHSDRIICLNQRDSKLLERLYGRAATDIQPICVDSISQIAITDTPIEPPFGLFVGGAFYANLQGARWLAREVAPKLKCSIAIVGKGFENYKTELESHPNINVVGTVDSVAEWYSRASFVLAPIFDGSGMKTKVAESLMYGRPIVGTTEAFVGYDNVADRVGFVCNDASSIVDAVEKIIDGTKVYNPVELRRIYEENYSYEAKKNMFRIMFADLT